MALGEDWKWWFIPTRPLIRMNLFEKLYKFKEIELLKEFNEEESDPNQKDFSIEK